MHFLAEMFKFDGFVMLGRSEVGMERLVAYPCPWTTSSSA